MHTPPPADLRLGTGAILNFYEDSPFSGSAVYNGSVAAPKNEKEFCDGAAEEA